MSDRTNDRTNDLDTAGVQGASAGEQGAAPNAGGSRADDRAVLATTGREARRGSFGPGGGAGMPAERSRDFGASVRRLGTIIGSEVPLLFLVVLLTMGSVTLVVLGPRLLGQATDVIVSGMRGNGIDFGELHRKLMVIGCIYLGAWVLAYSQAYILAGVLQRSMFALRESVETK
ncbi:MAG: ABC transporter ATP-binding protein, partial [Ilumatobacteraceae bacterium]